MTYPGPPGDPDERPLDGPDLGMGMPESGTQHATSTDDPLLVGRLEPQLSTYDPGDPLLAGRPEPQPPTYDPGDPIQPAATDPSGESFGRHAYPDEAGGVLDKVKAFANQSPGLFLGAALLAGWLVGHVFSSSDDDSDD